MLLLTAAAPAPADTTSWSVGPAGTCGGAPAIAADTNGNIYTYDGYSGMVKKYTGTGGFLGTVGPRTDQFVGLTRSSDDGVYVGYRNIGGTGGYSIVKYDNAGTAVQTIAVPYGTAIGDANQIAAMGADGAGNLYILDTSSSRVERLSNGSWTSWGSPGDGNGQFDFFHFQGTLAVASDGTVYVSDYTNRIQRFTATGAFVTAWGSLGSGPGQFLMLSSLAADSAGHVYASDASPHPGGNGLPNGPVIQEFDSQGNYLGSAMQGVSGLTTYGNDLVYGGGYCGTVYRFELTIPDVSISLSPMGAPGMPPTVFVSQPLSATAKASVPFGSITGYSFDFGAGAGAVASPSATATTSYMTAGTYRVTVGATSSRGGSATASVAVVVNPRSPANASPPSISGTAVEGQVLTEIHGTWNWGPVAAYGYRWVRCDRFGGKCIPIAGASAQTYTLRPADVGHRIRVRETASGVGAGAGPFAASAATAVVKALPKLSALAVSPGAFRAARSGSSITTAPRLGTEVSYKLANAARVRFTIQRVAAGGRRFVTIHGSFTVTGRAGKNNVRFSGRLNGRPLAPGTYRLVATPTANGTTGIAHTTRFTILR